jgi:hypothetical protein
MTRIVYTMLALTASLAFQQPAEAERLSLGYGLTEPFYAPKLNIQWAVPVEALPRTVTVFELVHDARPEETVSNLMSIGRFRPQDRLKALDTIKHLPSGVYAFRAVDDGRTLVYDSLQGAVDYRDESAYQGPATGGQVEGVPGEAAALDFALRLLPQLGISTNDMVKKASGELRCVFPTGSWGHMDKETRRMVTYVNRRGIGFTRLLDGKEIDGQRAVFIEFGNHAKLGSLEVRWCSWQAMGTYPTAQAAQMLQWLKEGRARVLSLSGPSDARYAQVAHIRKLTVTGLQPRYPLADENHVRRYLYPYALLSATAEFGEDDTEQVVLYCPIIAEGLPKAERPSHAGFSIYPSNQSRRTQQQGQTNGVR